MPKPNCFFGYPNCWRSDANPDVQAGAKVLIAGKPEAGNYPNTSDSCVHASSYAKWGMVWDNHYQNNMRSWDVIMKQFAGQSFNYCSFDECAKVIRSSEFREHVAVSCR